MVYLQRRKPITHYLFPLLAVLIVTTASCSNGVISGNTADAGIVDVITIDQGTILSAGQRIPMNFFFDPEAANPNEIEVMLARESGETVDSVVIPYSEEISPFELSELSDGTYTLNIRVKESDGTVVGDETVVFFFTAGEYAIQQVTSYPTTIEPDSDILIFADYTYPEGASPFVRWSFEDEVIAFGPLSQIGSALQWHVPDEAGIYTLNAELFPFVPASGEFDFIAPLTMKGSVFTVNSLEPGLTELSPEPMYSLLYHLRGNFKSHGTRKNLDVSVEGNPLLEVNNGMFGYRFRENSGLVWNENLFAASSQEDYDIVFQLKGMFDPVEENVNVLSVGQDLVLTQQTEGFALSISGEEFFFPFSKDYVFIGLRIAMEDGTGVLEWFDEGERRLKNELSSDAINRIIFLDEETRFGFGMSAIIDELGIIASGNNDDDFDQFNQAMKIKYGKDLLLSEGFDDNTGLNDERIVLSNNASIDELTSSLVLGEDGALIAEGIELTAGGIEIVFESDEGVFSQLTVEENGEVSAIDLEYADGYYHGQIIPPGSETSEEDPVYFESGIVTITVSGPGVIKSFIVKNIRKEIASSQNAAPTIIGRLASL